MKALHRIVLTGLAVGALLAGLGVAGAAAPPQVFSVVEGRDSATDRPVLVLVGKSLTKFKDYALTDPLGLRAPATPDLLLRTKGMIVLGLPADLPAGTYDLGCGYGTTDSLSFQVRVGNGAPLPGAVDTGALAPALRADLDDAATLAGHAPSWYADASNLSAGTLDPARFSAIADLQAEGKIGTVAGQVAAGNHDHDARYYTKAQSDAQFAGQAALGTAGTVNDPANPVDWSRLRNVPAGFADGVDNDTTYAAGVNGGITFNGTKISVLFGGTGSAVTVARSDHNHNATYLALAGGSLTGNLGVTTSGASGCITATTTSTSASAVTGAATDSSGTGSGVLGTTASDTGSGVTGENTSTTSQLICSGVHGKASSESGRGVFGEATTTATFGHALHGEAAGGAGAGVYGEATSTTGYTYGVIGKSASSLGYGLFGQGNTGVYANSSTGNALVAVLNSSATPTASLYNLAIFQTYGTNKARIDNTGKGFFNGGTQASGADFAESVAVATPKRDFEPGDVIVIDTASDRTFALSKEAESSLVAGVYSTKPGMLAMPHDCAGDDQSWITREIPLAVVGIVPVKVCDEGGPIVRGDLLVTASLPGHARKAPKEVKPGTLLGKALGRLEKGKGVIEVLLVAR